MQNAFPPCSHAQKPKGIHTDTDKNTFQSFHLGLSIKMEKEQWQSLKTLYLLLGPPYIKSSTLGDWPFNSQSYRQVNKLKAQTIIIMVCHGTQ